jgi:flagellar export protein FliJ
MADTLAKLLRIRDRERRTAHLALARAQHAEAKQAERLEVNQDRVRDARGLAMTADPVELARYHAFQLRMEMARRREENHLAVRAREVAVRQEKLVDAMREARLVERLQEIRADQMALDLRRAEDKEMDEVGLQSWYRRSA